MCFRHYACVRTCENSMIACIIPYNCNLRSWECDTIRASVVGACGQQQHSLSPPAQVTHQGTCAPPSPKIKIQGKLIPFTDDRFPSRPPPTPTPALPHFNSKNACSVDRSSDGTSTGTSSLGHFSGGWDPVYPVPRARVPRLGDTGVVVYAAAAVGAAAIERATYCCPAGGLLPR